jgi:hypothetical protein
MSPQEVKDRNMGRDPRVTLTIQDRDNLYRYLEVRGCVVEIREAGTDAHIDSLATKYLGWRSIRIGVEVRHECSTKSSQITLRR